MAPDPHEQAVKILPPRKSRSLVIHGWSVPMMEAAEADGGEMWLLLDERMALVVDAAHFDQVAIFVADVIATCFGYGAHPRDDDFDLSRFKFIPHPTLSPKRVHEITAVETEGEDG